MDFTSGLVNWWVWRVWRVFRICSPGQARACARPVMRGAMTLHILHTLHNTEWNRK